VKAQCHYPKQAQTGYTTKNNTTTNRIAQFSAAGHVMCMYVDLLCLSKKILA